MKRFLPILLLCTCIAHAEVREIASVAEIVPALAPGTLLVFDIDNTLLEPVGNIGSDQWYYYLSVAIARDGPGLSPEQVQARADDVWTRTLDRVKVRPVEALTPTLVREQQQRGLQVMGLTARAESDAPATFRQLHAIGVDLQASAVRKDELRAQDGFYSHGVLFVGEGVDKGKLLVDFLARIDLKPARVVFVDDKPHHARNVDAALGAAGIPVVAFRYGAADAKVRAFNEVMGEATEAASAALLFHGRLPD
jgi:hypothetical protein